MNLAFYFGPKLWFWTWTKLNNELQSYLNTLGTFLKHPWNFPKISLKHSLHWFQRIDWIWQDVLMCDHMWVIWGEHSVSTVKHSRHHIGGRQRLRWPCLESWGQDKTCHSKDALMTGDHMARNLYYKIEKRGWAGPTSTRTKLSFTWFKIGCIKLINKNNYLTATNK